MSLSLNLLRVFFVRYYCILHVVLKQKMAEAGDIDIDLLEFRELQRIISAYISANTSSDARLWYVME